MYIVGIDENGLGPVLGPLVVTGSLFRCSEGGRLAPGEMDFSPFKIRDSKKVFSQKNKAQGERAVLAMAAMLRGTPPATCSNFLDSFTSAGEQGKKKECPGQGPHMCWHGDPGIPLWYRPTVDWGPPGPDGDGALMLRESLRGNGMELVDVRAEVCCVRDFNSRLAEYGGSKTRVNFDHFERLIRYFHERYGPDILFSCGKNMATMKYESFFRYLRQFPLNSKEENPESSIYHLAGLGEVRFLVNGEEASLPIAVSSLFGKYIREVFMERQNTFFAQKVSGLPRVSGYRDRVTKDALLRIGDPETTLGIPRECFLREK